MLQQTTVPAVKSYFEKFTELYPDIHHLAQAPEEDILKHWAGLGYYARARNLHKCAKIISEVYGGNFPKTEIDLKKLPGIGDYTASAIIAIAFNKEAVVVDGNVERIIARLARIREPLPKSKAIIKTIAASIYEDIGKKASDLPQSLMDLGSMVCTPKSPKCNICPISYFCEAKNHKDQEKYPVKAIKEAKPTRIGDVYWIETTKGEILIEKRSTNRMLGGMMALPGTDWDKNNAESMGSSDISLFKPDKKPSLIGEVRHSFTHFHLILNVHKARVPIKNLILKENQRLICIKDIDELGFPSLYKKVVKLAISAEDKDE